MPPGRTRVLFAALGAQAVFTMCLNPVLAEGTHSNQAAKSGVAVSDASKAMQLTMPVKDNGFKLGDVIVLAGTDGSLQIQKDSLITAIRNVFRVEALRDFEAKLPTETNIDLNSIVAAGIKCSYNANDLEILIEPTVEQRPRGEVTGTIRGNNTPANIVRPANLSGFVNAHFGAAFERDAGAEGAFQFPAILFDGAVRWNGIVLDGETQVSVDGTFTRRATRLIYDLPEEAIRMSVGDVLLRPSGSLAVPPLLGVAIEKTYADLQPSRNIRPTGKRSFRVERPSDVSVLVNGREARRLRLAPGEYGLSDLPLSTGDNHVQLRIRDEFGKEELVDYSILFNRTLLQPGVSEWSIAAGIVAEAGPLDPVYDSSAPIMSGMYRRGLSESLTGALNIQASKDAALFGGNALQQTPMGLLTLDASASAAPSGLVGWSLGTELELDSEWFWKGFGSAQIAAEIISGSYIGSLEQIPTGASRIRLSGSLAWPLPGGFTASVSGYYLKAGDDREDGFGTSVAVNRVLGSDLSVGIYGTYEERGDNTHQSPNINALNGVSVLARLNYRPSLDSDLTLQYDSVNRVTTGNIGSNFDSGATHAGVTSEMRYTTNAWSALM